MPHPLDGAKLKIVRAKQHLDALKREIGDYLDGKPYEFSLNANDDWLTLRQAVIVREPPDILSCILGDCLANLRASLDYIAWELAAKHVGRPLIAGKDRIYFPLSAKQAVFNTDRAPELLAYSIPRTVINVVESVQPYQPGYEPLAILHALVNQDKHRLPLFTIARLITYALKIEFAGKYSASSVGCVSLSINLNAVAPGETPLDPADMNVDGQIALFVALQDRAMPGEPVDVTLENIFKCVASTIAMFDGFF